MGVFHAATAARIYTDHQTTCAAWHTMRRGGSVFPLQPLRPFSGISFGMSAGLRGPLFQPLMQWSFGPLRAGTSCSSNVRTSVHADAMQLLCVPHCKRPAAHTVSQLAGSIQCSSPLGGVSDGPWGSTSFCLSAMCFMLPRNSIQV